MHMRRNDLYVKTIEVGALASTICIDTKYNCDSEVSSRSTYL